MFLHEKYFPITATPFRKNEHYVEILPCEALRPYIRCIWGSSKPSCHRNNEKPVLNVVTPDTCVDIIFQINETTSNILSLFCGINDKSFKFFSSVDDDDEISIFAVRFFAWSAVLFSEEPMNGTKNNFYNANVYFEKIIKELEPKLLNSKTIEERRIFAENILLQNIYFNHQNSLFQRAISEIVDKSGNIKALVLAKDLHISSKQMERIFNENIGATPKKIASLVRYQCLWQDICYNPYFSVMDSVYKYGYTDQAHLLNDFKKIHGFSIRDAVNYAFKDDDFLQEKTEKSAKMKK